MVEAPRRGFIYWARMPDELGERPAVVISTNGRNLTANTVMVIPLTTNIRPSPTHVTVRRGEGGLPRDSMARCKNLVTIPKNRIAAGPIGNSVAPSTIDALERGLMRAIGRPEA